MINVRALRVWTYLTPEQRLKRLARRIAWELVNPNRISIERWAEIIAGD